MLNNIINWSIAGKISFRKSDRRKKKERKILSDESKIDEYWVKEPTFGDKSSSDPDLGSTSRGIKIKYNCASVTFYWGTNKYPLALSG